MKKLAISFILLLVIGGTVFYIGWVQFALQANTYAVIFTKTGGWDDHVTEPGRFSWRWERLIPTNMTIHKFELATISVAAVASGELPNAQVYADVLEPRPDFSYELRVRAGFTIDPDALPQLAAEEHITSDNLESWIEDLKEAVADRATAAAFGALPSGGSSADVSIRSAAAADELSHHIRGHFPTIQLRSLHVDSVKMPDLELYELARTHYRIIAEARTESQRRSITESAEAESATARFFALLERYGEILDRHPVLLELLKIEGVSADSLLSAYTPPRTVPGDQ